MKNVMSNYVLILKDCVETIFPKLRTELNFHRQLAKGGVNAQGMPFVNKRTGKPYLATTQLNHVLVGLSGLVRLLNYLSQQSLLTKEVTTSDFKRVCALFCLHDLHKDDQVNREVQTRDTSIKPDLMLEIATKVGLTKWLGDDNLTGYEYYEAMIHLSDATHGNRKYCRGEINYEKLYSLVRLADSIASVQSLEEGTNGLKNRLKDFSRTLKHLHFFYHKINDYRGLTTNFYHQSIAKVLQEKYQLYPFLFFDNGTVYLGEYEPTSFNKKEFLMLVINHFNQTLQNVGNKSSDELEYNGKTQRFEKYIFAFCGVDKQLEYLKNNSTRKAQIGWFQGNPDKPEQDFLSKRFNNQKFQETFRDQDNFLQVFNIMGKRDQNEDFAQKWEAVSRYLGGVLNLLNDVYLAPSNWQSTINFLGNLLKIHPDIQTNIIDNVSIFNQSGTPEFSHILAYHYLNNLQYDNQSTNTIPIEQILDILHHTLLSEIVKLDNIEKRNNYVEDELALDISII